jgi:hypothetical protein
MNSLFVKTAIQRKKPVPPAVVDVGWLTAARAVLTSNQETGKADHAK